MIEIPFVALEATLVAAWLVVRITLCVRRGRVDWRQELPFYTRVTDTNDLMLNVSGVAIGYCLYALFLGLARRGQKAWRPHPRQGRLDAQNS